MSFFFKDPKTCMSPWRGLALIVFVCSFVLVALLIGRRRYKSSLGQDRAGSRAVENVTDFNRINTTPSDNRLRF